MKSWRGYTLLDLFLIGFGIIAVTASSIIFNSSWYILINTLLGLFYVFTQAKGKVATQFLGLIYFCFYIFISYKQKLYGEALLYLLIMIPMYIYGVFHWLSNKDKKDSVVIIRNNLSKNEWIIFSICLLFVSVGIFYVLKILNTAYLIMSTISFISIIPAVYLLIRRCKWNHVGFLINDLIVPFLWLFLVLEGDYTFITMTIYFPFQIIYDIYGLSQWIKLQEKQKTC
ncbi:MAG: nicotinamide mononucleotide transporter [Erysipelotrichaceae bacterium]|nr:nicotinamide mononucleotide transporter [Erysipelotrichaceae bacterium]